MITNLRLQYSSPYNSSFRVRQLMLQPYTTLQRFVLIINGQFISFFFSIWAEFTVDNKGIDLGMEIWEDSLLWGLVSPLPLPPMLPITYVFCHDFHVHIFCLDILVLTCYTPKNSRLNIWLHSRKCKIFILFLKYMLSCFQLC